METNPASEKFQASEIAPMHTAEHLLNGTMDRMWHCGRAFSAHIERKKSKCDYHMTTALSPQDIQDVENKINDIIRENVPVTYEFISRQEAIGRFNLNRLPDDASETVRVVHIGDYDECLCVGIHVDCTGQLGRFRITSTRFAEGVFRIVFRLDSLATP